MAPPIITSAGQTRSRLPTKWIQEAATTSCTAPTTKHGELGSSLQESPLRWSTHTLAADPHDTVRSRADSTTSTYVDTFAHRRKNRLSDLTFVDLVDDVAPTCLVESTSHASSLNDLSATLHNDDDQSTNLSLMAKYNVVLPHTSDIHVGLDGDLNANSLHSNQDDKLQDDEDAMAYRIDRLMAATMEALEASNRLVLDTLSSRAKLAQLNAMEAALDSHLDARESHLRRQIQAVTDMTDFVSKTSAELQKLISPCHGLQIPSVAASVSQSNGLAHPSELHVRDTAATGIVQALDRDATIGKTAVKRLERMLQTPSPTTSLSAASAQRRSNSNSSRRAFSISNFASVQSSITEETPSEHIETSATPDLGSSYFASASAIAPVGTIATSSSRTLTSQKKRSVSYDSRAPGALKLMSKRSVPATAAASGLISSASVLAGATSAADASCAPPAASDMAEKPVADAYDSNGLKRPMIRPSLMDALRQDAKVAPWQPSLLSKTSVGEESSMRPQTQAGSGLPSYTKGTNSKSSAYVGVAATAAESTLAALLGMPSAAASTPSRTETPSESSYFDSAMEDSLSSASPPTPSSMHAINSVLATPWKPASPESERDNSDVTSQQQRSARRASVYSSAVSPRASLSLSDRDRAAQLSLQLAELRAERVTWNPNAIGSGERDAAGNLTSESGGGGGGALRALQKLNERSAAKIASRSGLSSEEGASKRVSLSLGLPNFSALRPSASRSTSTTAPIAPARAASSSTSAVRASQQPISPITAEDASSTLTRDPAAAAAATSEDMPAPANAPSSSLLGGGWRSWASWNAAPAMAAIGEHSTPQKP